VTRYDILTPRKGKDGKTRWMKIGAGFPRDKGGFSLVLDALPLPDAEGKVSLLMSEPLERDAPRGADHNAIPAAPGGRDYLNDEIPF